MTAIQPQDMGLRQGGGTPRVRAALVYVASAAALAAVRACTVR